jgi:hypothetical protein
MRREFRYCIACVPGIRLETLVNDGLQLRSMPETWLIVAAGQHR